MSLWELNVFLATAFVADGGSTEGTSYWQYGLSNLIPFGEMLRIRTRGEIDILATDRLKAVATYPIRMMLSPGRYANFSDCEEAAAGTLRPRFLVSDFPNLA